MTNICSPCMRGECGNCTRGVTVEGVLTLPPVTAGTMHIFCDCTHEQVTRIR